MRIGIYISTRDGCSVEEAVARIQRAEAEGFDTAWVSQLYNYDALTLLALAGRVTKRIELGTWVVPTYPRHPSALAAQALTVQAASGNRLTLALGLSHKVIIENQLGLDYSKPIRHMREYLSVLRPLLAGESVRHDGREYRVALELSVPGAQAPQVLIAALGPQMLNLAGRLADGTAIWLGGAGYLREFALPRIQTAARAAQRPPPRMACGFPIAVTTHLEAARVGAAALVAGSAKLPSYRAALERGGTSEPASVAIIGDEAHVHAQLAELAKLGVTDLNAVLFGVDGDPEAWRRSYAFLAELARGGL